MTTSSGAVEGTTRSENARVGIFPPQCGVGSCSPIAVCVMGPCPDQRLLRQTVESALEQDYGGQVMVLVPNTIMPSDREWHPSSTNMNRKVVVSRASLELNCTSALAIALSLQPEAEFVALLNCGEKPPKKWLLSLKQAQEEFDADVVTGPVKAIFDEPPPDWILAGGYFDRCGIPSGPIPRPPAFDNSLIRSDIIPSCLPDVRSLSRHEVEWIELMHQMEMLGLVFIWANEAIVFDVIPKCRMDEQALLAREYAIAHAAARAESRRGANKVTDAIRRTRACVVLMAGIAARSVRRGDKGSSLRARLMLARARGALAGSVRRQA